MPAVIASGQGGSRASLALLLSACALLAAAGHTEAQAQTGRIPRVVMLNLPATAEESTGFAALRQGLRDLGWIEGRTITLEYRGAGTPDRNPQLAAEIVRSKPDVIVSGGGGAAAALATATSTIPIVVTTAADPVASGWAASLARPSRNITGQASPHRELSAKRLEILKEALPRASRVATLWHRASDHRRFLQDTEAAARALGIELEAIEVRDSDDLRRAMERAVQWRAGALLIIQGAFFGATPVARQVAELALRHRLPAVAGEAVFADQGGLIYFGANVLDAFRRSAAHVDKILKGAQPGDLPFELPATYDMVINLQTARALDITIPPAVRLRATRIIE